MSKIFQKMCSSTKFNKWFCKLISVRYFKNGVGIVALTIPNMSKYTRLSKSLHHRTKKSTKEIFWDKVLLMVYRLSDIHKNSDTKPLLTRLTAVFSNILHHDNPPPPIFPKTATSCSLLLSKKPKFRLSPHIRGTMVRNASAWGGHAYQPCFTWESDCA